MNKIKSKKLLVTHYNNKYSFVKNENKGIDPVVVTNYPCDRYEAAVYWGAGNGRALEIGAGSGSVALLLKHKYDEYVITELSEERIKFLKKFLGNESKIKIIQNDIEEEALGFPSEYFDTIIMVAIIEHLIEPISVLKYCYSLLKPKGRLLISTPNIAKWTRRVKLLFGFFPSTSSYGEGCITREGKIINLHDEGHLHYFTFRSLSFLLKGKAGFTEIKWRGHGRTFLSRAFPQLFSECFVIATK